MSCNVIDGSQMIIMGGSFPNKTDCDAKDVWGQHNLNLGKDNVDKAPWYQFLPNLTSYRVPSEVTAAIGGGFVTAPLTHDCLLTSSNRPSGSATMTTPVSGWDAPDLSVYFSRRYSAETRMPTRPVPTVAATSPPSVPAKKDTNVGAIAGGAVGGGIALVAVIAGLCLCLRRRRRAKRDQTVGISQPPIYTPPLTTYTGAPAELAVSAPTSPSITRDVYKPDQHDLTPISKLVTPSHGLVPEWLPHSVDQIYYPPPSQGYTGQELPTARSPHNGQQ